MNPIDHLTPALERLWIDEVRRLHALWHLGPPEDHANSGTLAPRQTVTFKREEPNKRQAKRRHKKENNIKAVDTIEWPCKPDPEPLDDPSADGSGSWRGWGSNCSSCPVPTTKPMSAERQAGIVASQAQNDGVQASKEFFSAIYSSDGEGDESMDDEDDHERNDTESKYSEFFLDLFEKDVTLKGYFTKFWEKGEFCCLVCLGIGKKLSKRYGDCIALVQHARSITNTKGRGAHRAFARVLCQVLGWDINRLPTIVISAPKQPGETENEHSADK